MTEKLRTIEDLKGTELHGFMAKMNFAIRVLPLVIGTPHEGIVVDCFDRPRFAPLDFDEFGNIRNIRQWPATKDELESELRERIFFLQQTKDEMEKLLERGYGKEHPVPNRERDKAEFRRLEEKVLENAESSSGTNQLAVAIKEARRITRMLERLVEHTNPKRLPEVLEEIDQTTLALKFLEELSEQGKI